MASDPCSQWTDLVDEDLTVAHVQDLLQPVSDDLWVAAACTDRLVDKIDVQRALIDLGIARTDHALSRCQGVVPSPSSHEGDDDEGNYQTTSKSEAELRHSSLVSHFAASPTDATLCRIRATLLERLDRLNTFVEISQKMSAVKTDGQSTINGEGDWEDDPWAEAIEDEVADVQPTSSSVNPPLPLAVFLTQSLTFIGCALATQLQFDALQVLFECHQPQLFPHRFSVLDHIPEYAHPSDYHKLLPAVDALSEKELISASKPWRDAPDWSEIPEVQSALKASGAVESWSDEDEDGDIHALPIIEPLSADEVQAWYKGRVDHIVSSSGLIDVAIGLVQHGASQGVAGLDELGEDLILISRLIYDSPGSDEQDTELAATLSEWRNMQPPFIISQYLAHSTPTTIVSDIRRLVMPYLFVLESRYERAGKPDPKLTTRLLYDCILKAPLTMAAPVFEASKPTLVPSQRLVSDDEDLARLALACLYGSNSLTEWSTMSRIFECLPAWNVESSGTEDEDEAETTVASLGAFLTPTTARPHCTPSDLLMFFTPLPARSLSRALDILDAHLESGEIFARWNVPVPLRWFLHSAHNETQQRAWAIRMARVGEGYNKKLKTESDWVSLLNDMLKLARTGDSSALSAFGLLSNKDVIRIFYGGLLNSGNFAVARSLLNKEVGERKLDTDTIEDLCLASSREFYDNASSGNYNFGEMKLAYDCLGVAPSSPKIEREREFIEATSRVYSFNVMSRPGVPISPIEIRLTKDKLSLVSRVLSSNETSYKHSEVILDLMRKLGFRDDVVAEVKTLAMIADTALHAEDFSRAFEMSERMVDTVLRFRQTSPLGPDNPMVKESVNVCWVACFQLGRQPEFNDIEKKLALLGRALELCPPENMSDILTAWRRLEAEDIEGRQDKMAGWQSRIQVPKKQNGITGGRASTLSTRLHDLHLHSPSIPSAPDAAALASHALSRVAANFPFSVRGRTFENGKNSSREGSQHRTASPDVQAQAKQAFQRGIGWLIGAEEDEL